MEKQKALLAVPLIVAFGCGSSEEAQPSGANTDEARSAERFEAADFNAAPNSFTPRSQGATIETFVVELAGEPIARVQEAAGLTLSSTDKATKRKQLATAQAVVESGIQALGGTVKARYRDAYNGLRVRISSAQVPALQKLPGVVRVHRAQVFQPNNVAGAQRIAAPGAWTPLAGVGGYRGEGVKIAIIDSGIDSTHADLSLIHISEPTRPY